MELLSPAGSLDALRAAVSSGADAVYMGGKDFSARRFAKNFSDDELAGAINYCQKRNVKSYIAVNTLITDRELEQMARFLEFIYEQGADGIIVQDLGAAKIIREFLPDMPLHASTQMSIHTLEGARELARLGFNRVILARELNGKQIKEICENSDIEIEAFVHGALCVCYSGQCLMSSMIGGRSGNRGKCAQPCRQMYNMDGKKGAMLSLKDLSLINHISELKDMGVSCIKIEGRMKGPEYISVVTSTYRKALDGESLTNRDIELLESVFFRGGYTDEYFTGKKTVSMYAPTKPENPYLRQSEYRIPPEIKPFAPEIKREHKSVQVERIKAKNMQRTKISLQVSTKEQLYAAYQTSAIEGQKIYMPPSLIEECGTDAEKTVCLLPRIGFDRNQLFRVREMGITKACASNIGQITELINMGFDVTGDYSLNIFNSHALALLKKMGVKGAVLSPELMLAQIRDIAKTMPVQVIAYGRIPLMVIETPPSGKSLIDKTNAEFPIMDREILNSCPIYMADKLDDIKKAGVTEARLMFTVENGKETADIINAYMEKRPPKGAFTRGKFYTKLI